jgi:hypothetical protein
MSEREVYLSIFTYAKVLRFAASAVGVLWEEEEAMDDAPLFFSGAGVMGRLLWKAEEGNVLSTERTWLYGTVEGVRLRLEFEGGCPLAAHPLNYLAKVTVADPNTSLLPQSLERVGIWGGEYVKVTLHRNLLNPDTGNLRSNSFLLEPL